MKTLRLFWMMLAGLLCFTACDYYPVVITVTVQDEAGHDRLDPDSEYFIGEGISAVYEGQVYPVEILVPDTKTYAAQFYGLRLRQSWGYGYYYLEFGEFDGASSQNVTVKLVWPDGTSDTIQTRHVMITPLAVANTWKLNGERVTPPIILVK